MPGCLPPCTVHRLVRDAAEEFADTNAHADKDRHGGWKMWTYQEYYEEMRAAAKAMLALGLTRFGGVGVLGRNSHAWFTR